MDVQQVVKLLEKLTHYTTREKDEDRVLRILKKLKNIDMTLELLKETKAGKVVHKLEKTHGSVGSKAKEIVQKWKALLPQEATTLHQVPTVVEPMGDEGVAGEGSDSDHAQPKRRKIQSSPEPTFLSAENKRFSSGGGHARVQRRLAQCRPSVTLATHSSPSKPTLSTSQIENNNEQLLAPLPQLPSKLDPASLEVDEVSASNYSSFYEPENDQKKRKATLPSSSSSNVIPKKKRTQVYSGRATTGPVSVPKLFSLCIEVLIEHIDAIEEVGPIPVDLLRPVLERCSPQQLKRLEHFNPHFVDEDDELWHKICRKDFREAVPAKNQTWRELYMEKDWERESRLKNLSASIKSKMKATQEPVRKAQVVGFVNRPDPSRRRRGGWGSSKGGVSSWNNSMASKPVQTKLMKQTMKMAKERSMMTGRRR